MVSRERGVLPVAGSSLRWAALYAAGRAAGPRIWRRAFTVDGQRFRAFHHPYNWTWLNERAVEIPLARASLAASPGPRMLEVGNVLAHYSAVRHVVVDKYEHTPGVRNVDVLDLPADQKWDLIVSVSTLEHVGVDDEPREPEKAVRAAEAMMDALVPAGRLFVTIPVGYNAALDDAVRSGALGFDRVRALRRVSELNRWEQVPVEQIWSAPYDFLLYAARGLLVCDYERPR